MIKKKKSQDKKKHKLQRVKLNREWVELVEHKREHAIDYTIKRNMRKWKILNYQKY